VHRRKSLRRSLADPSSWAAKVTPPGIGPANVTRAISGEASSYYGKTPAESCLSVELFLGPASVEELTYAPARVS
jgi:hypothetical protein